MNTVNFQYHFFEENTEIPCFSVIPPGAYYIPIAQYRNLSTGAISLFLYSGKEYTPDEFQLAILDQYPNWYIENAEVQFFDWTAFRSVQYDLTYEEAVQGDICGTYNPQTQTLVITTSAKAKASGFDICPVVIYNEQGNHAVTIDKSCYIGYMDNGVAKFRRPTNLEVLYQTTHGSIIGAIAQFASGISYNFLIVARDINNHDELIGALQRKYKINDTNFLQFGFSYIPIAYISTKLIETMDSTNFSLLNKHHVLYSCNTNSVQIRTLEELHPVYDQTLDFIPPLNGDVRLMPVMEF